MKPIDMKRFARCLMQPSLIYMFPFLHANFLLPHAYTYCSIVKFYVHNTFMYILLYFAATARPFCRVHNLVNTRYHSISHRLGCTITRQTCIGSQWLLILGHCLAISSRVHVHQVSETLYCHPLSASHRYLNVTTPHGDRCEIARLYHPVRLIARWINGSFRGAGKIDKTQPKTVLS
jgi:hypothetical protein